MLILAFPDDSHNNLTHPSLINIKLLKINLIRFVYNNFDGELLGVKFDVYQNNNIFDK